ncbi:hypothetical protein K0U83_04195 [bacterium]|nr:hypothetical protein [bacterium]
MKHRTTDPDTFAIFATLFLFAAAAAALALPACSPVGDRDRQAAGPNCDPDFTEAEPNDFVDEPDTLPVNLAAGDIFSFSGTLGGDTINSNGAPGTLDWFRCDAAMPCQANVRLWVDGPAFLSLNLVEWLDQDEYRLRAHDFSGSGYIELTIPIDRAAPGSGLGIGIMETSQSATPGTTYCVEVTVL